MEQAILVRLLHLVDALGVLKLLKLVHLHHLVKAILELLAEVTGRDDNQLTCVRLTDGRELDLWLFMAIHRALKHFLCSVNDEFFLRRSHRALKSLLLLVQELVVVQCDHSLLIESLSCLQHGEGHVASNTFLQLDMAL